MYASAIFVISPIFGFYSGHSGPIKVKLKLSKTIRAEIDVCQLGGWTFPPEKRSEIAKTSLGFPLDTVKLPQTAEHICPPGMWTCSTGRRSEITIDAPEIAMAPRQVRLTWEKF